MEITADSILGSFGPALTKIAGGAWLLGKIALWVVGIVYVVMLFTYNVKVEIMDYTKGKRAVIRIVRAKEVKNRKTNTVYLKLFDITIIGGTKINLPESECIFAYKSMLVKKMYKFVHKDGIYHPVINYVVGKNIKYQTPEGTIEEVYGGIETSRDFDIEEAIANKLERDANAFRNKKPIEIVAMYGLMAIVLIGSLVIIVYSLKRVGDLFVTLQALSGPIKEGVQAGIAQQLGPG